MVFFPKFAELWSSLDKSTRSSDIPNFKIKVKVTLKINMQIHSIVDLAHRCTIFLCHLDLEI